MARKIRFTPDGGALYEVTCRTVHSRFLLRPGPLLNEIIVGALGRAQRLYPLEICAFFFASSHFHLLVRVEDSERLARFMGYFNSKLAREVARSTGWRDKVFSRRYQAILVSDEEEAQVGRLVYILSHGCKENQDTRGASPKRRPIPERRERLDASLPRGGLHGDSLHGRFGRDGTVGRRGAAQDPLLSGGRLLRRRSGDSKSVEAIRRGPSDGWRR